MTVLEFWPDYGPGPLWTEEGHPVDLAALSIEQDLAERLIVWKVSYSEDKVPIEGSGDEAWLDEGKELLGEVRSALDDQHQVVVTEPWWDEGPISPSSARHHEHPVRGMSGRLSWPTLTP